MVVDAVVVGGDDGGVEGEVGEEVLADGEADDVGVAVDEGVGVAGVDALAGLAVF